MQLVQAVYNVIVLVYVPARLDTPEPHVILVPPTTMRCFIARVGRRRAFKSARQKHLNLSSGKAQPAGDGHLNRTHQTAQQAHRFLGKEACM